MFLFPFTKSISRVAGTLSLLTVSNLIIINSASAFSVTFQNGSFESSIAGSQNGWNTIGDVTTTGTIDSISQTNGAKQAIITTGYIQGNYTSPVGNRNDDSGYKFNQSNTNPVSADTNSDADALQGHFGFSTNAFSINRVGGISGIGSRTSKEGSGMYQDITVNLGSGETGFTVSFDWSYLTNDGSNSFGGEQDFSFWSLGQVNGSNYTTTFSNSNPNSQIEVLKSSSGSITAPTASNDYVNAFNYTTNGRKSYTVKGLGAGTYTYRVGFGVVDVDSSDRSSALLLDNFMVVEEVPFEFSPGLGLWIVGGIFGLSRLYRQLKNATNLTKI